MPDPSYDMGLLSSDWTEVYGTGDAADLDQELIREVPVGHELDGRSVHAVAVKRYRKDTLFWLPGDGYWAWVHLTWTVETNPRWPATICSHDWDGVVAELQA